jgi:hypothetical protein
MGGGWKGCVLPCRCCSWHSVCGEVDMGGEVASINIVECVTVGPGPRHPVCLFPAGEDPGP